MQLALILGTGSRCLMFCFGDICSSDRLHLFCRLCCGGWRPLKANIIIHICFALISRNNSINFLCWGNYSFISNFFLILGYCESRPCTKPHDKGMHCSAPVYSVFFLPPHFTTISSTLRHADALLSLCCSTTFYSQKKVFVFQASRRSVSWKHSKCCCGVVGSISHNIIDTCLTKYLEKYVRRFKNYRALIVLHERAFLMWIISRSTLERPWCLIMTQLGVC